MALVVFLRGVNVGGHKTLRPSVLARQLARYGVVNIGAAGTLVFRRPVTQAKLRAELAKRLPFDTHTHVMICEGREIRALAKADPYGKVPKGAVRFVSVMARRPRRVPATPISLPMQGAWLVKFLSIKGRLAFGLYKRHMKTIGYLGKLDGLIGVPVTTRNWNTITSIIEVLQRKG